MNKFRNHSISKREQIVLNKIFILSCGSGLNCKLRKIVSSRNIIGQERPYCTSTAIRFYKQKPILSITKNKKHRFIHLIEELLPQVNALHCYHIDKNVKELSQRVTHLLTHHGEKDAIKRLKQFRLFIQRYYLEQKVINIPFVKADKSGGPKKGKFLKVSKQSTYKIRYVMSVLRIFDSFKLPTDPDLSPITSPSTADKTTVDEVLNFIHKSKLLKSLPDEIYPRLIMSNKSGPNGPAIMACVHDHLALRKMPRVYVACYRMFKMGSNLDSIDGDNLTYDYSHKSIPSKIVAISDKFGKTRVIAIADGWSNVALSSLHDAFMQALRHLSTDYSYKQDDIPLALNELGSNLFSCDMTAFTDRFPRLIIKEIVKVKYGEQIAEDWETIISNRDFIYEGKKKVNYSVGTPMGVLSSGALSTFAHHVITEFAVYKVNQEIKHNNKRNKKSKLKIKSQEKTINYGKYKYIILGDDKVDSDIRVSGKYKSLIRGLGVEINESKCTESFKKSVEIAKRLYTKRGEITGLPVTMLQRLKYDPSEILEFLRTCNRRGYTQVGLRRSFVFFLDEILSRSYNPEQLNVVKTLLKLPTTITNAPSILSEDNTKGGHSQNESDKDLSRYTEEDFQRVLHLARHIIFVKKLDVLFKIRPIQMMEISKFKFTLTDKHPLLITLDSKIDVIQYLDVVISSNDWFDNDELEYDACSDNYSVYKAGMRGDYTQLKNIPILHNYNKRFVDSYEPVINKFDVLFQYIKLLQSNNCNDFLVNARPFTDTELFEMTLNLYKQELSLNLL